MDFDNVKQKREILAKQVKIENEIYSDKRYLLYMGNKWGINMLT